MVKVIFRVDASHMVGGGHLSRAMVQSECLRGRGIDSLVILKGEDISQKSLSNFHVIPSSLTYQEEASYLDSHSLRGELCIIDLVGSHNLHQKKQLQEMIFGYGDLYGKVAFFDGVGVGGICQNNDDLAGLDLLIRPYATAEEKTGKKILSGFKYYIYQPEYYKLGDSKVMEADPNSILITFGRSDPDALTEKVLSDLIALNLVVSKKITVIIGDMFLKERVVAIQGLCSDEVEVVMHPKSLEAYFKSHEVIICGTGLTKYEACLFERVVIVFSASKSDFELQEQFQGLGLSYHIGPMLDGDEEAHRKSLEIFMDDPLGIKKRKLNAGNGLNLICNRYEKLLRDGVVKK